LAGKESRQEELLKLARKEEQRGKLGAAYKLFLDAGAQEEAARILALAGKHGEAGRLLLSSLGAEPSRAAAKDTWARKIVMKAGIYFSKGGMNKEAAKMFMAAHEWERAADAIEKSGDKVAAAKLRARRSGSGSFDDKGIDPGGKGGNVTPAQARRLELEGKHELAMQAYVQLGSPLDAARVAASAKRFKDAAELFMEAGKPIESASCRLKAGDASGYLDALTRVQKDDPNYRKAAMAVVRAAIQQNLLGFQIEHFLSEFIMTGPQNPGELESFYLMGMLYEKRGFLENALEMFSKVIATVPSYRDARTRLEQINNSIKGTVEDYKRIMEEEDSFRKGSNRNIKDSGEMVGLPDLPELPDLPDLPDLPQVKNQPAPVQKQNESQQEVNSVHPPPSGMIDVGSTLAGGRYSLKKKLGEGGVAIVFQARDEELDEDIAIKIFTRITAKDSLVKRFKEELKFSRQLVHPNIVRLYDFGIDTGYRYITMELLLGRPLDEFMNDGPMDFKTGIGYLMQACMGLNAAHEQGAIHRDMKPANLFVTDQGTVKVMDFGIAKWQRSTGLTETGSIAGTPEYIAPEQVKDFAGVTPRTDIYSLGVVAFEMFTGELPFDDDELMALLMKHVHDQPPNPSSLRSDMPLNLENVILKCLEKEPDKRFNSCLEMVRALQEIYTTL